MKDEKWIRLNELLDNANVGDLSKDDREFIEDVMGMTAFEHAHELRHKLAQEKWQPVSPNIKRELISKMKQRNKPLWLSLASRKTPVWSHLIQLLILGPILWVLLPQKEVITEKRVVEVVNEVDTITIQLPPDTVYIDKLIQVEVPVYLARNETVKNTAIKGVSMAEKEDLQELLIGGE